MNKTFDLIVIGGGVLGTFHAYHALQKKLRVCLVEQHTKAIGATTRNFGQVVPSGMNEKWQRYGRRSLEIYKDIQSRFDISVKSYGSVYLASDAEEEQLLAELSEINYRNGYPSRMMSRNACLSGYPGLSQAYVRAGLFFPDEVTVEPLVMIHRLQQYLCESKGLEIRYRFPVVECQPSSHDVRVRSAGGETLSAAKVIVCNGSDFQLLFPDLFAQSDLELSKLQMMQTGPQPDGYRLPGSVLTGWSIRRYEAFRECPCYMAIKEREAMESPQRKWGVHILFKQAADGSVIIGDSHQYAPAGNPEALGYELDMELDRFILEEAAKIIRLPDYRVRSRWYGVYSQSRSGDLFNKTIAGNIHIVTGIGGKGMTGSAGYAEESIEKVFNS